MDKEYSRKPYTPPKKNIEKNDFSKTILPVLKKLAGNSEIHRLLYELGQKGARLDKICATLHWKDIDLIFSKCKLGKRAVLLKTIQQAGFKDIDLMYIKDSKENNVIEAHKDKVKKWGIEKRRIKGAVSQFINLPSLDDSSFPKNYIDKFNKDLQDIQQKVGFISESYLNLKELCLFPQPLMKTIEKNGKHELVRQEGAGIMHYVSNEKPNTKKLLQFKDKIAILFQEIFSIGYSKNSSYTIGGKLLNLSYPAYYKDSDPNNFRSIYTYHKNKAKK